MKTMPQFLVKVAVMAGLALGLLGTVNAIGTAENYNGAICKDYVNYQVWMAPNVTIASIEASLVQEGMVEQTLKLIPPTCLTPLMELVCSAKFPRVQTSSTNGNYNVQFACKSTCQTMVAECGPLFTAFGKGSLIPDCDGPINGTVQAIPPNGVLYQPDGSCNVVTNLNTNGTGLVSKNQNSTHCPAPFIPDTMLGPGGTSTNPKFCESGCCIPCPAQYSLYPKGKLELGYKIADVGRIFSTLLTFMLLPSYIFFAEKRAHPNTLIFWNNVCFFFFSVVVVFPLSDRRGIQCVDEINSSTQLNNMTCAVQGAMLIFFAVAICAWVTMIIVNLHLHMVWSSAWFSRNYTLIHTFCWTYPSVVTAVALGLKQVKWETGHYCLLGEEMSSYIFFYPVAALIFPAFLIHVYTFIYIARITVTHSNTQSALSSGGTPVISPRRHIMNVIKIQWRAALVAVFALIAVMYYWLFFFLQIKKIRPEIIRPNVRKYFVSCLLNGGDQDTCAEELAPYLPPYGLMISAEILISCLGIIIFIVFFRPSMIYEWSDWFHSLMSERRSKKSKEFNVI
ncbi:hypothetical protein BGX21_003053 [Mortierella sp. AD011]|nr:hypothetical protein BGX21_003053 [Mortierella sp. AD011]